MAKNDAVSNCELIEKYPFLAVEKGNYERSWYDSIPEGWRKAFGPQMLKELNDLLVLASERDGIDWTREYKIVDVKEKWGYLHWYASVPACIYDEYDEWEKKYETLSYNTCVECGANADGHTIGWVVPACSHCAQKHGWEFFPEKKGHKS